jgi:hypothetical protein
MLPLAKGRSKSEYSAIDAVPLKWFVDESYLFDRIAAALETRRHRAVVSHLLSLLSRLGVGLLLGCLLPSFVSPVKSPRESTDGGARSGAFPCVARYRTADSAKISTAPTSDLGLIHPAEDLWATGTGNPDPATVGRWGRVSRRPAAWYCRPNRERSKTGWRCQNIIPRWLRSLVHVPTSRSD